MLSRKSLIGVSFLLSIMLAVIDFYLFRLWTKIAFYIHNSLGLLVGAALIFLSYRLAKKKAGNKYVLYLNLVVGLAMVTIHAVKLSIGNCI